MLGLLAEFIRLTKFARVDLPALEITLLLAGLAICLVCRAARVGLILAYVFVYRWVWLLLAAEGRPFLVPYLFFGGAVALLTTIDILCPRKPE